MPAYRASPVALDGSQRGPSVSGKIVLFTVLGLGVTLVLGVGTFAALTRPPRSPSPAGSAEPVNQGMRGW